MMLAEAIRLSEVGLALALMQQSVEHLAGPCGERWLFLSRLLLAALLLAGFQPAAVEGLLLALGLVLLRSYGGPYNGGSDRMTLLLLTCLFLTQVLPGERWREAAAGYLAVQLVLSYMVSGWVKLANPDWRSGQALKDILEFSNYPVSENLRRWAHAPRRLLILSWGLMIFEVLFPLSLISAASLAVALALAALFHLANACLFGLNRFLWIWLAAYPCLIWFQQRVVAPF